MQQPTGCGSRGGNGSSTSNSRSFASRYTYHAPYEAYHTPAPTFDRLGHHQRQHAIFPSHVSNVQAPSQVQYHQAQPYLDDGRSVNTAHTWAPATSYGSDHSTPFQYGNAPPPYGPAASTTKGYENDLNNGTLFHNSQYHQAPQLVAAPSDPDTFVGIGDGVQGPSTSYGPLPKVIGGHVPFIATNEQTTPAAHPGLIGSVVPPLSNHRPRVAPEGPPFQCPYVGCDKSYRHGNARTRHYNIEHNPDTQLQKCSAYGNGCSYSTKRPDALTRHEGKCIVKIRQPRVNLSASQTATEYRGMAPPWSVSVAQSAPRNVQPDAELDALNSMMGQGEMEYMNSRQQTEDALKDAKTRRKKADRLIKQLREQLEDLPETLAEGVYRVLECREMQRQEAVSKIANLQSILDVTRGFQG